MTNHEIAGLKLRDQLLARDPEYYQKMGRKGGKMNKGGIVGFAAMSPEKRIAAARKGGLKRVSNIHEKKRRAK